MKIGPLTDASLEVQQRTSSNASLLLIEVLKHCNTHVDLLKHMMQGAQQLLDVSLGLNSEQFHPHQFASAWPVLMELLRALARIWLPQRQTRLITDSIQVFINTLPLLRKCFEDPPDVRGTPRLGFVRLSIAQLLAFLCSGRLVSLFVQPLLDTGLFEVIFRACWDFPQASVFHQVVFSDCLIPMIRSCLPLVDGTEPASDSVFVLASKGVSDLLEGAHVWDRLIECHFSYTADTESLRNKFAHNGYLTQLANALMASRHPASSSAVLPFVSQRLDWTNTVENTPITSCVYSKKLDGVITPDKGHSGETGEGDDEGESTSSSEDDFMPAIIKLKHVMIGKQLSVGSKQGQHPLRDSLDSFPDLLPATSDPDKSLFVAVDEEIEGATVTDVPTTSPADGDQQQFNDHLFWSVPIPAFDDL
jgi:hypothetical protein